MQTAMRAKRRRRRWDRRERSNGDDDADGGSIAEAKSMGTLAKKGRRDGAVISTGLVERISGNADLGLDDIIDAEMACGSRKRRRRQQ